MSNGEITKFTVSEPDDDGDMHTDVEMSFTNSSGEDVRLVKAATVFFSGSGVAIGSGSNKDTLALDPGEDLTIKPGSRYLKVGMAGNERNDIRCVARATLYKREFHRLGEVDLPKNESEPTVLIATTKSSAISADVKIAILRMPPDSDGDVNLEVRCGLYNLGESRLDEVTLKIDVLDEDDSVLRSDETSTDIDPKAWGAIDTTIWGLSKGVLKSAKARMYLTIYHPVLTINGEGVSSPAD